MPPCPLAANLNAGAAPAPHCQLQRRGWAPGLAGRRAWPRLPASALGRPGPDLNDVAPTPRAPAGAIMMMIGAGAVSEIGPRAALGGLGREGPRARGRRPPARVPCQWHWQARTRPASGFQISKRPVPPTGILQDLRNLFKRERATEKLRAPSSIELSFQAATHQLPNVACGAHAH